MRQIDYYFTVVSPWTYLAGNRPVEIAARHGASLRYKPVDPGALFARTGGLPLPQRHESRQAYRLQELRRQSVKAGMPLTPKPAFFPTNPAPAAYAIIAAQEAGGGDLGALVQSLCAACWAEERNVAEDEAASGNALSEKVAKMAAEQGAGHVVISARIEEELAQLPPGEAAEFLAAMGLEEPGLDRLIRAGYDLLGLQTYFTVGPKEARAWTIRKGTLAPQAAGVIHGDFEKGFIRAETIAYDDYVAGGGEAGAREAGRFRVEGKSYEVRDGDVLHFLFNA